MGNPTTNNRQPTTNNQPPTANNQQPTTNNQQLTTNHQPTTNQQPTTIRFRLRFTPFSSTRPLVSPPAPGPAECAKRLNNHFAQCRTLACSNPSTSTTDRLPGTMVPMFP